MKMTAALFNNFHELHLGASVVIKLFAQHNWSGVLKKFESHFQIVSGHP